MSGLISWTILFLIIGLIAMGMVVAGIVCAVAALIIKILELFFDI